MISTLSLGASYSEILSKLSSGHLCLLFLAEELITENAQFSFSYWFPTKNISKL